jgi:hypothetical protein
MNSTPPPPGRAEILSWLTGLGERPPGAERLDSMELAWLVHQVEQRYAVELDDDQLTRIITHRRRRHRDRRGADQPCLTPDRLP